MTTNDKIATEPPLEAPAADEPTDVPTGEVKVSNGGRLTVGALGSCVAVVAFDPATRVGGIAHVMLPGAARPHSRGSSTRYAEDGIRALLTGMTAAGADPERLALFAIGGANVLKRVDDPICSAIVDSVYDCLEKSGLSWTATETGGMLRRSCALDCRTGRLSYTIGGSSARVLWAQAAAGALGTHGCQPTHELQKGTRHGR